MHTPLTRPNGNRRHAIMWIVLVVMALGLVACGPIDSDDSGEGGVGSPSASFTQDVRSGLVGTVVQFSDTSSGQLTSWSWDFAAAGVSTERNPQISFDEVGEYTVVLAVSGPSGSSSVTETDLIVIVDSAPVAGFTCTPDPLEGHAPFSVSCTDESQGATSWSWDFGDGTAPSTEQNPSHDFLNVGTWEITQTATGPGGSPTASVMLTVLPLEAGFSCLPDPADGALPFTVTCSDESKGATSWSWDFGDGSAASTEQNPSHVYTTAGAFTIEQTAIGADGQEMAQQGVTVRAPVAGLECLPDPPPLNEPNSLVGYVPFNIVCMDQSQGGTQLSWDFGDGSGGSNEQNPTHQFSEPGSYTITQTLEWGTDGSTTATQAATVHQLDFTVGPSETGPAPFDAVLTPVDSGAMLGAFSWIVDGVNLGKHPVLYHRFTTPGTHTVLLFGINIEQAVLGQVTKNIEVSFGPPEADFDAEVVGGFGPFDAQLLDSSGGSIDKWEWNFGDGTSCVYPAAELPDPLPDGMSECDSNSPLHAYDDVGSYDVMLSVTGPADEEGTADTTDSLTRNDHVRVYIGDPSFEEQTPNGVIGGAWTALRPADETEAADHLALTKADGVDLGMPSAGLQWAMLDGQGTDGQTAPDVVENGIRQDFLRPPGLPVIEFDFALLYAEPPASPVLDAMTASVSDGVTTVEIPSAQADTRSPYAGFSQRFPFRDSSPVRSTPRFTASLDLEDAFPGSTDLTRFILTIRTTNDQNGSRSPRAYVDDVRFVASVDAVAADFDVEPNPALAGEPVVFSDATCEDDDAICISQTSWRWDFDTQGLPSPPDATGSDARSPTYAFDTAGTYDVTLEARRGNAEATTTTRVTVLERAVADFEVTTAEPWTAPVDLEFLDTSVEAPLDPIVAWAWDFAGWGASDLQDPGPISFLQVGTYTVTLTVTTSLGDTVEVQHEVVID